MEILKRIDGLPIAPISDGADEQNRILREELPFKIWEYESGQEHNGWIVPQKWEVVKAEIKKDGQLIYDGKKHPLGVIGYSRSFKGKVSLSELKNHLYYFKKSPDDIVYHCDLYYKPHLKTWGFSLPYNVFLRLTEGEYEVDLETTHTDGKMKVLEYEHQGELKETVIFNAHNCHAAQLNDGPAGYVVFMEIMNRLKQRQTRFSYRLVVGPEHLGTVFYLAGLDGRTIDNFKLGIFLEIIGHDNPVFALQESFSGKSLMDRVAHHVLKFKSGNYWSKGFRQVLGNDESVWEAPGYEVPMISLSRVSPGNFEKADHRHTPYHHLSSDNFEQIKEDKLAETVNIIMEIIEVLEKNCWLKRKFTGLIALSNPKYDLYISPGTDPSINQDGNLKVRYQWYDLMNRLPRYFDENISILDIAIKHDLPFNEVYDYLTRFREKGLIEFINKDYEDA